MRRSLLALAATTAGAGYAGRRAFRNRVASWDTNPDPSEGDPLGLPEFETIHRDAGDGARLHGRRCGDPDGPTLVMVHGFVEHTGFWGPVARRLAADGFDVVLVDQRGHGESERGEAPYTTEVLGEDLAGWLTDLDVRDGVLAGHSMGGVAAMACAHGHPDVVDRHVRALALVTTLARPMDTRGPDIEVQLARLVPLADRLFAREHLGLVLLLGTFGPRPARPALEATRSAFLGTDTTTRLEAISMMRNFDLRPGLADISVPTTVIAGSHDGLTPVELNEEIADLIPGARLEVLPGVGHMLPFEAPEPLTDLLVQATKP